MNPAQERFQRLHALFSELADMPPDVLKLRLDQECADDPALRAQLENMLAIDRKQGDPVQSAITQAADDLLEERDDRMIGRRIGPYEIESVLGHGGMSTVYTAQRVDRQYQQKVAIKVLHHAAMHPRMRSRLHSERHILASLDHTFIARLIDSGEMDDGTPYIVMEHIEGETVDVYCDQRTLFVRERLELFVQLCSAVQYAHRNLVVHRDIKPGNVLVTNDGTPKLLDFGIAKLLAPDSLSYTLPVTRLQERILTPENAAPEQVLGRPITTATDIYALGVLLYQLITGRSPYRLQSYSQLQLERAICMDDPVRPSQAVIAKFAGEKDIDRQRISDRRGLSPERLRARLAGDLDAIVAMAMRKEPDRRYASAQALADDIQRHLGGQPVLARQGDWRYNSAKFLRRHLLPVSALAAIMLGMAAIIGVTLYQNQRIERARQATERERDRAREVSSFLVDVFSQADPFNSRGHNTTAKELLDRGAEKIMNNLDEQPEVRAQLLESIGLAYRRQGLASRAVPMFEHALAIRRQTKPPDRLALATSMANLALALAENSNLTSAENYLDQAVALSKTEKGAPTKETADILRQLGHLKLDAQSKPDAAIASFLQALEIYRQTIGNEHIEVAYTLSELASSENWKDDIATAEDYERQAIKIFGVVTDRDNPDFVKALDNLGYILTRAGKYAEADQLLTEALEIERRIFGPTHQRVAETLDYRAQLFVARADFVQAIASMKESVKLTRDRLGPTHYLTGYRLQYLAKLYQQAGDLATAESVVRESLSIFAATLPPHHLYVASSRQLLGDILTAQGDFKHAEIELREALAICSELAGAHGWRTARAEASLGWMLLRAHRDEEGLALLEPAQIHLRAELGPANETTREASQHLAAYYKAHQRDADAQRVLSAPLTR